MRALLAKDLLILRRSKLLVATLVVYPIVIALLIGFAISSPPAKPTVAIYTGVKTGSGKVKFGSQRIDLARYANELFASVHAIHVDSPGAAVAEVRSGRALAALIIPKDIDSQIQQLIQTGIGNPSIEVVLNDKNPLDRDLVQEAIQSRVANVQTAVSNLVMKTVVGDLEQVLGGGKVSFLGRNVELLGLRNTRTIVRSAVAELGSKSDLTPALNQVVNFATIAIDGLALAAPEIGTGVADPLTINEHELAGSTTPTATYAIAIATVFLAMFIALVLSSGMLALERSENAYRRLIGGMVRPVELLAEKIVLGTLCASVLTIAAAAAISVFVSLDWGRFELWVAALALAAFAFAALGALVGAFARDIGVASLLAFLIALPVAFMALVPASALSTGIGHLLNVISFLFPFRAALTAVSAAFGGGAAVSALGFVHLAGLALVYGVLARLALVRFGDR